MRPLTVSVFASSRESTSPALPASAIETGRLLAGIGATVVYGGAATGLMRALADGVISDGGRLIGVRCKGLPLEEPTETRCTEIWNASDFVTRRRRLIEVATEIWVLPGGIGTLDEATEALTDAALGQPGRPVRFINVEGFFTPLQQQFEVMRRFGLLHPAVDTACWFGTDPTEALAALRETGLDSQGEVR